MREGKTTIRASFVAIVAALLLFGASARAEDSSYPSRSEYMRYCSACHGEAADGNGPVANVLTPRPPALTTLHPRYGDPLSTKLVAYVSGETMPRAHGTSDMPVWGRVLREKPGDGDSAAGIIWKIVRYLDRIQVSD